MQFNISVIPRITIFPVPGMPMTFSNRIKWEVKGSRAKGTAVRRQGVNMHTKQYFDSFGLPASHQAVWSKIAAGLNQTISEYAARESKVLGALATKCKVTFPESSLGAIRNVAERSTKTIRYVMPMNLSEAFPIAVRKYARRHCWTVGKTCTARITRDECTVDKSLYCETESELGRPDAIPSKFLHSHASGVIVFKIYLGCNHAKLDPKDGIVLLPAVLKKIKEAIAFLANLDSDQGMSTRDVDLTFVEGLPDAMEATVTPRSGDIQKQFSDRAQIQSELSNHIGQIKGIDAACPNKNAAVKSVSTPKVKVCPRAYCTADTKQRMRSHGLHTACQPKTTGGAKVPGQKETKNVTLESCQEICTTDNGCYGIDYENAKGMGNCRIWMQPLTLCARVPASDGVMDMTSSSECFSKCDRRNSPVVLQQPDWMAWVVA
jgi:hypothetical protein